MSGKKRSRAYSVCSLLLSVAVILGSIMTFPSRQAYAAGSSEGEVHIYADTPGDVKSAKYSLTANGTEVPVIKYSQNGNNFDVARFSSSDATPEYTVQVTENIDQVAIYPERYYPQEAIQVSGDKRSVTFTMSEQLRYAFVMINGGPADQAGKPYLAIINDPPEKEEDIPDKNDENVLDFKIFMEQYLAEHPNSERQQAEPAGTTSGGIAYDAGTLVDNTTAQVRFPDKRKMTIDDATYALQAALDAIYMEGSAYDTLYFPAGTYVCSGLEIRSRKGKHVTIYLEEGALIKNRLQECMQAMEPAIGIWDSENITISGRGIFDGNGVANYRKDRHDAKDSCHQGGAMIVRSSNIVCNDTYVRDAKQWNWESHGSKNCVLNNVKGLTPYNQPWVDGLDMASAQDLTINGALTLGNDDNFASGHYNPSDGFPDTVPGYDQYNSDSLQWDTEDSDNVSVNNTLGWSFSGGNGIRMGHDTYGHALKNYTFTNVNTTNFTGGGNGITVQNGQGNKKPYPKYEQLILKNCSFDTTRVGTNFNINGLSAEEKIGSVTLEGCWFSNQDANSYVNNVETLTIKDHYVGGVRALSTDQAKLDVTEITNELYDWTESQEPSKYEIVTVETLADATVKSYKTEKEQSYGTLDYIRTLRMNAAISDNSEVGIFGEAVGNDITDDRDAKISFLSFDAAKIREKLKELESVSLQLTYIGRRDKSKTGEDALIAVPVTGTWSEEELKWTNMPALDASMVKSSASFRVDKKNVIMAQDEKYDKSQEIDGTRVTIDVTEWVRALDENAQVFSLAVCDTKGWELAFVSREGVDHMDHATADMEPALLLSVKKAETESPGENKDPEGNKGSEDDKGSDDKKHNAIKVDGISISAPSKRIAAGKKVALSVKVTPKNADNAAVKWSSGNEKYATVNEKGIVTTKRGGKGKTVTIRAAAQDGSGKYATIRIRLMQHKVTKVTIKNKVKFLKAGKKVTLKTIVKSNGKSANKTLKWSSSNTRYATVSSKGKVTAKKAGKGKTVTISVISTDGTNKKDRVKIKIR